MPLSFPIALSARAALDEDRAARTIAEARELAGGLVTLVSEWLRPNPAEREEIQVKADAGVARGFVQLYEDAKGRPVLAVTFWKPQQPAAKTAAKTAARKGKARVAAGMTPVEDNTDDLYFSKPGSRNKRRRRSGDPNQLDLFTGPDQQGNESRDPHNPFVVIVEEEGDGATFGLAQEARQSAGKDKA